MIGLCFMFLYDKADKFSRSHSLDYIISLTKIQELQQFYHRGVILFLEGGEILVANAFKKHILSRLYDRFMLDGR